MSDLFDVPFCRVQKSSISFSELSLRKEENKEESIKTKPGVCSFSQTKDRSKYNNKLIKQLKAIGVNVDEETGQVVSDSSVSHSDYFSDQELHQSKKTEKTLLHLVDETLEALSDKNMDSDDDLSQWDPMKEAYEQRHFNSYQEPRYNTAYDEKHNPVRGTKISPAKGSEDEVTLYLSNIPMTLTEDGLKNMFSSCGRCRRVRKCRPKISNSTTTFGFVAYSSVREAEEAITKYDRYQFGKDVELRVRLSHGKERNVNFVPQSIDIQLGSSGNTSGNEESENISKETTTAKTIPQESDPNIIFPNMFPNHEPAKQLHTRQVVNGPRLYIQGISISITADKLEAIISEIVPCRDGIVVQPKTNKQFTTFGFVTVGSIEDAEKVIAHFNDFGSGRMKASYSEQSAKEYGKDCKTEEDDFYLKLYEQNNSFEDNLESETNEVKIKAPEVVSSTSVNNSIAISSEKQEDIQDSKTKQPQSKFEDINGLENLQNAVNGFFRNESLDNKVSKTNHEVTVLVSPEYPTLEDLSATETILPNISKHNYVPIAVTKRHLASSISSTTTSMVKPPNTIVKEASVSTSTALKEPVAHFQSHSAEATADVSASEITNTPKEEVSSSSRSTFSASTTSQKAKVEPAKQPSSDMPNESSALINIADSCNRFKFTVSSIPSNINPLEYVITKMKVQTLYSDDYKIYITHIESPYLMYGCLNEHNNDMQKLSNSLLNFYSNIEEQLSFNFKAGALSAVYTKGAWKRGLITKIEDNLITLFLIDDGTEITSKKQNIRPLIKKFKLLPAQAIPLKLFNVQPCGEQNEWSAEIIDFLKSVIFQQTVTVKPEFKDRSIFAVRINHENKELHRLLEEKSLAQPFLSDLPQVAKDKDRKDKEIFYSMCNALDTERPIGTEFDGYVTFAPSPKLFFLRLFDDSKDMMVDDIENELMLQFQNEEAIPSNEIVQGQLYSVKTSTNKWHRGFVLRLYNERVFVLLIDYGSRHNVPRSCIFSLPEVYSSFPAQAITAQLQYVIPNHYSGYTDEAVRRFNELVDERSLTFKVMKTQDKMHRVLVFDKETGINIGEKLVAEGHAKFCYDKANNPNSTGNGHQSLQASKNIPIENSPENNDSSKGEEKCAIISPSHNEKKPTSKDTMKPHQLPTPENSDVKKSTPPRGILQRQSPTSERNTTVKPLGRGMIMGRGLSLLKERGLVP